MQKRFVPLSVFLAVLTAAAPVAAGSTQSEPADFASQLNEYVEVQEALAADDLDTAMTELEEFARITDDATRALAMHALEAGDIEELRARFKPLSESLTEQALPQGFARAYCPMYDNGSAWVQRDGPVRNPYYGAFMLTCGVVDAAAGAHMDHTSRQGGIVFMAPDSFHHIEGTFPEPGLFRLYATDNYREAVDVSDWNGRAVTLEEYDEATDEFVEVKAFDLFPSPDGGYLEALIPISDPNFDVPAEITAKVIFEEDFPAERFDFIFGRAEHRGGGRCPRVGHLRRRRPRGGAAGPAHPAGHPRRGVPNRGRDRDPRPADSGPDSRAGRSPRSSSRPCRPRSWRWRCSGRRQSCRRRAATRFGLRFVTWCARPICWIGTAISATRTTSTARTPYSAAPVGEINAVYDIQ